MQLKFKTETAPSTAGITFVQKIDFAFPPLGTLSKLEQVFTNVQHARVTRIAIVRNDILFLI